jgi:hypothetical protein
MNELEQTLQKILEKSLEIAEQTGDFVIEQAPDLLRQFFLWHTVEHIFGILLAGLIFFISTRIIRLWGVAKEDNYHESKILGKWYDDEEPAFFAYAVILCGAITSTVVMCTHVYKLVFLLIAPKLYLIEYFL